MKRQGILDVGAHTNSELTICRGIRYSVLMIAAGIGLPFLMTVLHITYESWNLEKYPGFLRDELKLHSDEIRLNAYGLCSILCSWGMVSFTFKPAFNLRKNLILILTISLASMWVYQLLSGPRRKGSPPFGEAWSDQAILIFPPITTGFLLMYFQIRKLDQINAS